MLRLQKKRKQKTRLKKKSQKAYKCPKNIGASGKFTLTDILIGKRNYKSFTA